MTKTTTKLINKTPNVNEVDAVEFNKSIHVSKKFLSSYFRVTLTTVQKWFNDKGADGSSELGSPWVELNTFLAWHSKSLNKVKSDRRKTETATRNTPLSQEEEDALFLETLPPELKSAFIFSEKDSLDKFKDLKEIEKRTIDINIKMGELIPSDKVDSAMAELLAIQLGHYTRDITVLPSKLNLTKDEIETLKREYKSRIDAVHKLAKYKSENKITDVLARLTEVLEHTSVDDVLKALDEF